MSAKIRQLDGVSAELRRTRRQPKVGIGIINASGQLVLEGNNLTAKPFYYILPWYVTDYDDVQWGGAHFTILHDYPSVVQYWEHESLVVVAPIYAPGTLEPVTP